MITLLRSTLVKWQPKQLLCDGPATTEPYIEHDPTCSWPVFVTIKAACDELMSRHVAMFVRGEGEVLVPAHLHFGKLILDRLRRTKPELTCMHNSTSGDRLTYSEFAEYAVRLASGLIQLGVGRGDTVMVEGKSSDFLSTGLAVLLTGAAYTSIESRCGRAVLKHKLNLTKPNYVICTCEFLEEYGDTIRDLDFTKTLICFKAIDEIELSVEAMVSSHSHVDVESFEPAPVWGQTDVALILYSSGTTGMSKGVLLTHLNCIIEANMYAQWYHDFNSLQTTHHPLRTGFFGDPNHSSTYDMFMLSASICVGLTVIYPENDDLDLILKIVQDFKIDTMSTVSLAVDMMLNAEVKYDLRSLRMVCTAGSMLTPKNAKLFQERYPNIKLINLYGTSEAGAIATTQNKSFVFEVANEDTNTMGSCVGRAAPGVTIKVVDVETRASLGPNQRGEVCVRGPRLMKGYLGATASLDQQGFYPTGDLGYYDDQKRFYLTNRLKDVISHLGYKVPPGDIESVLLQHPAIQEAAVVGKPTEVEGEELPAAFVVLRPGATATAAELLDYVAQQVTWNMQLRGGVRFLPELPRNSRRKLLRQKLKEMLTRE